MPQVTVHPGGEQVPVANIFVIGRNYVVDSEARARQASIEPYVSMKPTSAVILQGEPIRLPDSSSDVHYEIELVILIGKSGSNLTGEEAVGHIRGIGVGLDLTAHDLHLQAKAEGLPWAKCKGFPTAAPLGPFLATSEIGDLGHIDFSLHVNGERRQAGSSADMVYSIPQMVGYLSRAFGLTRGDLVFTGTPAGVATLHSGDALVLSMLGERWAEFRVA